MLTRGQGETPPRYNQKIANGQVMFKLAPSVLTDRGLPKVQIGYASDLLALQPLPERG
jgi:hypothetical protein